jgi:alginate O-acetyltransferase complex protein AlgI
MIFNTFSYFFILLLSALLYRVTSGKNRLWVLIISGVFFFVYYSIVSVGGFLGALCIFILLWEAVFSRLYKEKSVYCLFGVLLAVIILGFFKYSNFFIDSWDALGIFELSRVQGLFLPLGISFFTFEFIHYAVDRYKGKVDSGSFLEYLSFILFFPTMVAGPIKRFQDFKVSINQPLGSFSEDFFYGINRILVGLAKKFGFADLLTALTDHLNYQDISHGTRWILLVWLFAFGIKIYIDFSAYSDIAIGSARLFGIRVKENFNWPYFQPNITEFWKSWHISLYKWLVDYIYIPLGGSKHGLPAVIRNIMLTMIVSGFWHGASWNFIVWGIYHGILLSVHRLWTFMYNPGEHEPSRIQIYLNTALTFVLVNLGWAFFCMDLPTAQMFYYRLIVG